jgi:hypothetical protein
MALAGRPCRFIPLQALRYASEPYKACARSGLDRKRRKGPLAPRGVVLGIRGVHAEPGPSAQLPLRLTAESTQGAILRFPPAALRTLAEDREQGEASAYIRPRLTLTALFQVTARLGRAQGIGLARRFCDRRHILLVLPSLPSLALNLRHSFCDRPRGSMEEGTLLAELFMLRIDAMVRASNSVLMLHFGLGNPKTRRLSRASCSTRGCSRSLLQAISGSMAIRPTRVTYLMLAMR